MVSAAGVKMLLAEWLCNYQAIRYKPSQVSWFSAVNPFSEFFWETVRRIVTALGLNFYALRESQEPIRCQLCLEGKAVSFDWNDRAQVLGTIREIFKEHHYGPAPHGLTVDVGANIGIYSLFASGSDRVIAIEPFCRAWKFLAWNSLANRLGKKIVPLKLAISARAGSRRLFISELSSGNSFHSRGLSSTFVWVETKRLDTLLSELGIQAVDTLKVDAESSELEILESAGKYLLERKIKNVIVAAYHYDGEQREVADYLGLCGYRVCIHEGSGAVVFAQPGRE
jgi:FkbM family methyltransferase